MVGTSTRCTSVRLKRPACIEVYPHPATIGLFGIGRILKYKGGPLTTRQAAFVEFLDDMESIERLDLQPTARWAEIRRIVSGTPRQVDLNLVEDEVDAILCAHLAWLAHRPGGVRPGA